MPYRIVFVTCARPQEAKRIAKALVATKVAACVNVIPGLESFFWWEGIVDSSRESLLMIKTKERHLKKVMKLVKNLHSYQVPEIIALNISSGYRPYLDWIDESLR